MAVCYPENVVVAGCSVIPFRHQIRRKKTRAVQDGAWEIVPIKPERVGDSRRE
jgi:hypothetical protein